jgi:hypothetical protein
VKPRSSSPAERCIERSTYQWQTASTHPKSNYELFNCNNLNIRYWSWNYRGCWPHNTGHSRLGHFLPSLISPSDALLDGSYSSEHALSLRGVSTSLEQPETRHSCVMFPEPPVPYRALRRADRDRSLKPRHGIQPCSVHRQSEAVPRTRSPCRQPTHPMCKQRLLD